jgi:hypothetical protein
MTILRSLMVATVLLAGGSSLAIAQNGLPTGGYRPVAGGANGGGPAYGQVYGYGYRYGPRHLYAYSPYHHRHRHWRYY